MERRTMEEVVARYEFEPELKDVFVEGAFDSEVLTECFKHHGQSSRIVYGIDTVEIPKEFLHRQGLTDGNKQRVIALARVLSTLQGDLECRCLVDRDLDHWFGELETNKTLIWTDHCSIELYFFTHDVLQDILLVVSRCKIDDWQAFHESLENVLVQVYAMRLVDRELDWSMQWLPIPKFLTASTTAILFDSAEYIRRLLLKNARASGAANFSARLLFWQGAIQGSPHFSIRGHDLVDVLAWTIRAFRGMTELANSAIVERLFLMRIHKVQNLLDLLQ